VVNVVSLLHNHMSYQVFDFRFCLLNIFCCFLIYKFFYIVQFEKCLSCSAPHKFTSDKNFVETENDSKNDNELCSLYLNRFWVSCPLHYAVLLA